MLLWESSWTAIVSVDFIRSTMPCIIILDAIVALGAKNMFFSDKLPNNNFEVYIPTLETTEILDVSTPPPAYHLLNLNMSMDFKTSKKSTLTVGLGIANLLNTSYRNYLNLLRFYSDDLGRNFLFNLKFNY